MADVQCDIGCGAKGDGAVLDHPQLAVFSSWANFYVLHGEEELRAV